MVALKTVSARIRGSKADLEELGESVDDLAQGFSKYAEEIQALTGFNIMVEGTTDTFKDLYDIMDGISAVWDKLTDTQRARVSEILGGTRQLQVISSILGNWGDAVNAYSDAMNAAGVATQANATYMESAEAHINQFKATFQEFAAKTLDSGLIKFFIDLGTAAINLTDNLGGLKTMLLGFATIKAFQIPGIGGVAGGVMAGITGVVAIISAIQQHREALAQANRDAAEAAATESDELSALATEYAAINDKLNKSEEDRRRLSTIEDELLEKYGIEKRELARLTEQYGDLGEAIKKVTTRELSSKLGDIQTGLEQYKSDLREIGENFTGLGLSNNTLLAASSSFISDEKDQATSYHALRRLGLSGLANRIDTESDAASTVRGFTIDFGEIDTVDQLIEAYDRLGEAMQLVGDEYGYTNSVYRELKFAYDELTPAVTAYTGAITDNNRVTVELAAMEKLQGSTIAKTKEEFDSYRQSVIDAVMGSNTFIASEDEIEGKTKEVEAAVDGYLSKLNEFSAFYNDGEKSTLPPNVEQTAKQITELTDLSKILSRLKSEYDILAKAESDMKDGGGLSPDTIKALSDATDDYLDYLYEENGVIKLNTEAWNSMIDAQRQDTTESIRRNIEVLKQQRVELENTLNEIMYTAPGEDKDRDMDVVQRQLDANKQALAENVAALEVYEAAMSSVATATAEAADETQKLSDFLSETSSGLTSLADLQAAVSESYRISVSEAMKYAEVFPEILAQSQLTADGQIQLNQAVVDSFIQSSQAEINAAIEKKIAELEAEKEVIEAKKAFAEAKLQIVKAAGEAEGEAAYQTAEYILNTADELVEKLIDEGNEESEAYAQVAESMANNFTEFDGVVAEVADNMQSNLGQAADNAASSISDNMGNASESVRTLGKQIHEAARQMNALRNGQVVEYTDTGTGGAGSAGYRTSSMRVASRSFNGSVVSKSKKNLALEKLTIDLENTISGYEDEITKIDGSIANLRNILNSSLDKFASGGSSKSGGSGGGGKSGGSTSADVQKVDQEVIKGYESLISQYQKAIQVTQSYLDQAIATNDIAGVQEHTQKIIDYYRQMQQTVHDEAEYYRSLGYDETSDEIQKLKDLWWDYAENIGTVTAEAYQKLADNAKSSLDEIRSAYDTLKSAAQEYAESGFITINTLESIISMGVQYLGFLYDENGQLVINEQSIQRVIAARTEQYAVESALAYVAQVRQAAEAGDIATLNQLTQATQISTGATWDLVYAQMALINLSDEQYNGMLRNVQAMQSLTASAVSSIGQQTGQIRRQYEEEQAGLNKIMDATKAMIRQENQAQINATKESYQAQINAAKEAGNAQVEMLRNQKKAYDDQIEQKKKLLDQTQKQIDKEDTLAGKVQKIAKLQAKITQLSLDDSREAKAERTKLEEELANLQKDLADTQRQYEVDAQKEALDAEKQAYDNAMDAQISAAQKAADAAVSAMQASMDQQVSILQNSLNSEEKLYQAALARIDGGWDSLYGDLKAWNSEYGNMVESDLVSAWDAASAAVQRYGSYAAAVTGVQNDLNNMGNSNVIGTTAGTSGSSSINTASIQGIMTQMRRNSNSWGAASQAERDRLHTENAQLAQNLARFGVKVRYDGPTGTWIIESDSNNPQNVGRKLYDVYHSGGVVGKAPTLQYNETIAKLKNGEVVLTEGQGKALYKIVDFMSILSDKLGHSIDSSMLGRLFGNTGTFTSTATSAMGRGISALMSGGSGNIHVEHLDVTAPIHVVQKLDDEDIREHARTIGSFAAEYIKEGFVKRGVKATAALF